MLIVIGLTQGGTTAFYTYTTYMQKFLKLSVGLSDNQTTMVSAGSLIFAMCLQPIYGALSDRIGRKPLLIWFGLMGTRFHDSAAACAAVGQERAAARSLLIAAAWLIVAGYTSINAVVKAELFPDQSSSHWRRSALCDHDVDIRRPRRVHRVVVQVDRPRGVVLLLPHRR